MVVDFIRRVTSWLYFLSLAETLCLIFIHVVLLTRQEVVSASNGIPIFCLYSKS